MIMGSLLSYAGWFFFAAWSVVVGAINVVVFGKELLPTKGAADSPHLAHPSNAGRSHQSSAG